MSTAAAGKPSTLEQDPDYEPHEGGGLGSQIRNFISIIVKLLILQMGITILRPVSKHVQPKVNATVVSNLPPQMNSRHMRNNMLDKHGHVLSVIKNPQAMTNAQSTSTTGLSTKGGTCTNALLTHAQLMATHFGMMSSTWSGGICRRTMACIPPWGVQSVMGHFAANKASRNIFPLVQAKRIKMAPDRHHMKRKSSDVTNVQRNIPWRLHSCSTRKCTKALQRSMCAASVVRL